MITRRCTQRQFLLRPDAATNNAFTYCLIEAAQRCEIDVLLPCAMSNHYHAVIFDRCGRYPELVEHFHKMFARSQNALRGRWENFWASEQVCVVTLVDRDAVMDKLVYTAANPVQDHLVDRVHHWPGVNGLTPLLAGRPLRATRPLHSFAPPARCQTPSSCGSRSRPGSDPRPTCSPSYANASPWSRPRVRRSASAPAVGCAGDAPCSPSRGAVSP